VQVSSERYLHKILNIKEREEDRREKEPWGDK
jgi:hypothetical protein